MKLNSILPLIFLSFILVSCSKDDDSETSKDDIIVGTWGVFEYLEEDGRIIEADSRLTENQIIFYSDGSLSSIFLQENLIWKNIGNATYEISATGEDAEEGTEILELLNNNVLKIEYGNGEATFYEKVKN